MLVGKEKLKIKTAVSGYIKALNINPIARYLEKDLLYN